MRVYGLAVVRKEPNQNQAHVIRVENVGLDSQLNVLFTQTHTGLTFYPKKMNFSHTHQSHIEYSM